MNLATQFKALFKELDRRIVEAAEDQGQSGGFSISPVKIRILGQTALLLSDLPFPIAGTMDLDARVDGPYAARKILSELLLHEGLQLESDDHLIWMPENTRFHAFYKGNKVEVSIADAVAVIASKAKFKREKDRELIRNYLRTLPEKKKYLQDWGISWDWVEK